ncbi:hypothetical protein [Burkholderia pyrrocinia]|uniref:hypothetical protein n=1 Tax=Burkholderia TaxID=32008 RepID=UPI000502A1A3|nr:hypothetical protein [Burkholderia pyrrocinia]KFL54376.1 hypothetical protein JM78_04545 [Burkholderia pyrrocinia]
MSAPDKSCVCPVCGGRARWSLMKTGRVSITHAGDACGVQIFARSDEADEVMRDRFITANEHNVRNVREPAEGGQPVTYVQDGEGFDVWAK